VKPLGALLHDLTALLVLDWNIVSDIFGYCWIMG
jgi:hypothetical protein